MEIAPGIHLIPGKVGGRPLQLYLLVGDAHILLLDTGTAADPEQLIFPYLETLGLGPADIDLVINTHADADHVGGNAALKRASPRAAITCGEADRNFVRDPQVMITQRYNAYRASHDIGPDADVHAWFVEMLGEPQEIDWTWCGGETIRLGHDWSVRILSTPGHSPGHLTIFDPSSRTALMGDAVHGGIGVDAFGNPTFPAYIHVASYLDTIEHIRSLDANTLGGCHWDVMRGQEINQFLDSSLDYVRRLDDLLIRELAEMPQGATLRDLVRSGGLKLTDGRPVSELEVAYTFAANLEHLVGRGPLVRDDSVHPVRYHLSARQS